MRWILWLSTVAALTLACGGGKADNPPPAATDAAPPAALTGPVVDVQMTGNGTTKAAFEPATLTIQPGTTVRFINVSGGPHNIAFWADSVPASAVGALTKAMPDPITALTGPFLTKPSETYEVSFAGLPAGLYKGSCQPHVNLGMTIAITVK
jgi:plastocyanin